MLYVGLVLVKKESFPIIKKNEELAKKGKKRCKFCKNIKSLDDFNKVGESRVQEFCLSCKHENKKSRRDYYKKHYNKNKDEKKIYYKKWKDSGGLEKRRLSEQRRESRKNNLISDLTEDEWNEALIFFGYSCSYCGLEESSLNGERLHQEHIIPMSKGGGYTKSNIIPSCKKCNSSKNNMDLDEFVKYANISKERYMKIKNFMKMT